MSATSTNASSPHPLIAAAVRRERERAGLSLTELARRAGLAKSTLSQLEAGAGNPSVETLWALAVALEVPFSQLVAAPPPPVQVIRAGEGPRLHSEQADYELRPGDYASFPGDVPHRYEGLAAGTWAVLIMEHPQ